MRDKITEAICASSCSGHDSAVSRVLKVIDGTLNRVVQGLEALAACENNKCHNCAALLMEMRADLIKEITNA